MCLCGKGGIFCRGEITIVNSPSPCPLLLLLLILSFPSCLDDRSSSRLLGVSIETGRNEKDCVGEAGRIDLKGTRL